jgi:hypothetical protein
MATTRFGGWSTDRTYDMDAGSISFKWEQHSQELILAVENYMGGKLSIAGVTFHDLHTLNHILEEFLGEMWKPDDEI